MSALINLSQQSTWNAQPAYPSGASAPPSSEVTPQPTVELWGPYTVAGAKVFDVDSCVEIKYNHDTKVSSFPTELGAFTSYNKVSEPRKCKLQLVVAGHVRMATLIQALETELDSVNLYNIYTPEFIYDSMTLEKASYPRSLDKGRNMILAELEFIEVKQVSPAYSSIHSPVKPKHASKAVTGRLEGGLSKLDNYGLVNQQILDGYKGALHPATQVQSSDVNRNGAGLEVSD